MSAAMHRHRYRAEPALLDLDAFDTPVRLSDEDLYAEAGGSRRVGGDPFDEQEEDR